MSAAIKASLHKLNSAVQKLETAVVSVETRKSRAVKAVPQDDLFAPSRPSSNNVNNLNVRQLAQRLDTAINQVEKILKEG